MKILCSWFCEEHDVMVVLFRHPGPVAEAVTPNADGTYTVFINADLCAEKRRSAFEHALRHSSAGDFYRAAEIGQIEREAREFREVS